MFSPLRLKALDDAVGVDALGVRIGSRIEHRSLRRLLAPHKHTPPPAPASDSDCRQHEEHSILHADPRCSLFRSIGRLPSWMMRLANSKIRLSCVTTTMHRWSLRTLRMDELRDRAPRVPVQGRRGLVKDQHVGLAADRAGDRHALLLAAAQLDRWKLGAVLETDDIEVVAAPLATDSFQSRLLQNQRNGDVFGGASGAGKR